MQAQGALGRLTCDLRAKPGTAFCPRSWGCGLFPRTYIIFTVFVHDSRRPTARTRCCPWQAGQCSSGAESGAG